MVKLSKPTDAEIEILDVLWEFGPNTVKFVNEKLAEQKEVGYTTTLKLMQIMAEKGLLTREKDGRSHIYHPELSENEAREMLLDKFLKTAFGGSAKKLVMQVLGNSKTSQKELNEIQAYLNSIQNSE